MFGLIAIEILLPTEHAFRIANVQTAGSRSGSGFGGKLNFIRTRHSASETALSFRSTICIHAQTLRSFEKPMKRSTINEPRADAALAHAFARLALGLNIAMHGYTRLPMIGRFADGMVKQFATTFLPGQLVYLTAYGIAIGEALIGTCLFFGLFLRLVLLMGTLLMLLLLFGSTLTQQWEIASIQMIYVAFYAGLLGTLSYDRFSLDALRLRK
jgi:thiosulfate dehydrogenase (quinone) large subunit